jgi:VanZ family protein
VPAPDAHPSTRGGVGWPRWLWLWGPVVLYCALIFELSSVSDVPQLPLGMSDKTAHALLYSGLGFLVARALTGGQPRNASLWLAVATVVAVTLYGLSDETHQLFVPHREFDLKDLAADVVGGVAGTAALWLWGIIGPGSGQHAGGRA